MTSHPLSVLSVTKIDHPPNRGLRSGPKLPEGGAVKSAEQLCLACGLCCDGSLFGHVRLEPGEDAKRFKALGLPVTILRGQNPVARFPQPCTALCADRTCRLYANRPSQCRSFECGVYQDATAGRIPFATALRLVKKARRQADQIRELLRALGDTDENASLEARFQRTQRNLESGGSNEKQMYKFAELSLAVHHFNLLALSKFYTRIYSS